MQEPGLCRKASGGVSKGASDSRTGIVGTIWRSKAGMEGSEEESRAGCVKVKVQVLTALMECVKLPDVNLKIEKLCVSHAFDDESKLRSSGHP